MFRGFMPTMTLVAFGIGTGIGLAWSQGWIPLALAPVKSGKLAIEVTNRETLPPPPDDPSLFAARRTRTAKIEVPPDDPEVFEQQVEPSTDNARIVSASYPNESRETQATPVSRKLAPPSADQGEQAEDSDSGTTNDNRVRMRDRNPVRLDTQAGIEDASTPDESKQVTGASHQDPSEDSNTDRNATRESTETRSPAERLAAAEEKLAAGETLVAHRELSKLYWNHPEFRPQVQEIIDSTAKAIFFQQKPHYVEPYVIREGDRLEVIAKKYQLSWEYVSKLNRIDPKRVQIGQKLKVMKGPFGAVVDLRDFALTVHLQGYYVKHYDVGIGKDGSSPLGKFTVLNKLENPEYTDSRTQKVTKGDDPSNPLGERWIDLGDGYGIHGTIDPSSIGKAESRGCIRLRDADIVEVYNFLVKGSEVVIRK